jgi:hypothetical protein
MHRTETTHANPEQASFYPYRSHAPGPLLGAAEDAAPWGSVSLPDETYTPQSVVYDVAVSDRDEMENVLDRIATLLSPDTLRRCPTGCERNPGLYPPGA